MQNALERFVHASYLDADEAQDVYQDKAEEVWRQTCEGKVRHFWACLYRAAQYGQHRRAKINVRQAQRDISLSQWDHGRLTPSLASGGHAWDIRVPQQLCVPDAEAAIITHEESQTAIEENQRRVRPGRRVIHPPGC